MSGLGLGWEAQEAGAVAAALERRRQRELQRQSRVFNARLRTIGVDKDALDAQVKDRKIQEAAKKARNEELANEIKQNDKVMCMLEERQKYDIRNINKAVSDFQKNFQKPETRREFDLSDPQALKKDRPARLSDSDPRCTVSSLQKFMGEDLNYSLRMKFQKEQLREWSLQQQRDWKNALADKKFLDDLHDKNTIELDRKTMEQQRTEEETHRAVCAATKEFNRSQRLKEEECRRDAEWDRQSIQAARAQLILERHQQRQSWERCRALDSINAELSQEQKSKNIYLKEEEYSNVPTSQYFAQFNTTSR
ncbi:RIB43A-like with coiled-coils protein 2 isoform X4 [Cygnus atratus]|uniref:RIB43A-like with coiled-coils protein 2 isoform X4 n=1 Tax=Cygnus atratus TaxID=8868 RepID=UPI0021B81164|nr:RIB43A-like with coiled-coils protein 2 isoform X4 [Cygnus atratus]